MAHVRPAVERWLTWSGVIPLPAFLALHLSSELRWALATDVSDVVRPTPTTFAQLSSLLLVWLPLGLHVTLGVGRWLAGRPPEGGAPDVPPAARLVSRVASVLSLAFLCYHARSYSLPVWWGEAAAEDAGFRLMEELSSVRRGVPVSGAVYLLGLLATVAHACLGVHRGLLREGRLSTARKRRLSARSCAFLGALAFSVGAAAVIRVATGVLLR